MVKTLVQQVKFKAAPDKLFDIYLNSAKHGAAIGSKAKVSAKPGSDFMASDGYITGKLVATVPKSFVAQTWRAADWKESDPDSFLILHFEKAKGGSVLTMVHAGVPDDQADNLDDGWKESYWQPWKAYLKER